MEKQNIPVQDKNTRKGGEDKTTTRQRLETRTRFMKAKRRDTPRQDLERQRKDTTRQNIKTRQDTTQQEKTTARV